MRPNGLKASEEAINAPAGPKWYFNYLAAEGCRTHIRVFSAPRRSRPEAERAVDGPKKCASKEAIS